MDLFEILLSGSVLVGDADKEAFVTVNATKMTLWTADPDGEFSVDEVVKGSFATQTHEALIKAGRELLAKAPDLEDGDE